MAPLRAVKARERCSSTDPASLPDDLFHRVLNTVYRRGDVVREKPGYSFKAGGTVLMAASVSRTWHRATMQALTVARVKAAFDEEAHLLKQLTPFKGLTKITLYEATVKFLSREFLQSASENWPGLRTLVLRDAPIDFSGLEPASVFLPSLTSVVVRQCHNAQWRPAVPKLEFLPHWITSLESLTTLEVLECHIQRLPPDFGLRFSKLRRLRICALKKLRKLPESMGELASLDELVLKHCAVSYLPRAMSRLSALRRLKWIFCDVTDVSVIAHLHGLQYLSLSYCSLEVKAPAGLFAGLKLLRVLKLITLPYADPCPSPALHSLIHCTGLRVLVLELFDWLMEDVGWLPELTALRQLEISSDGNVSALPDNCGVPDLPANIGVLKHLERACLASGNFKTLPWSFGDLTSLRSLKLGSSVLQELPNSLSSLTNLTELVLSGGEDSNIASMNLGIITSLQTLEIHGFSITGIPEDLGFLPNLTKLHIKSEQCDLLLPRGFPSLQELLISGLDFLAESRRLVPPILECSKLGAKSEVAQLTMEDYPRLKKLRILFCRAESFPSALGHVHHLERLELWGGGFSELPSSLSSLGSLKELHLHGCQHLIEVPATLGTISSLTKLCLLRCNGIDLDSLTERLKEVMQPCASPF